MPASWSVLRSTVGHVWGQSEIFPSPNWVCQGSLATEMSCDLWCYLTCSSSAVFVTVLGSRILTEWTVSICLVCAVELGLTCVSGLFHVRVRVLSGIAHFPPVFSWFSWLYFLCPRWFCWLFPLQPQVTGYDCGASSRRARLSGGSNGSMILLQDWATRCYWESLSWHVPWTCPAWLQHRYCWTWHEWK